MSNLVDAVVVRGKFHEALADGTRRMVTPKSKNNRVKVTPSQLLAFKGILVPETVAKAQEEAVKAEEKVKAEAQKQMEKAQETMSAAEEKVEKQAAKEVEKEAKNN